MTMKSKFRAHGLVLVLAALLQACGGGGGGSSSTPVTPTLPVTPPVDAPLQAAATAKLQSYVDVGNQQLELRWEDPFTDETGVRVERRVAGGAWTVVETLPPTAGSRQSVKWLTSWQQGTAAQTEYRLMALIPGRELELRTPGQAAQVAVELPKDLALVWDTAEPFTAPVKFALNGADIVQSVRYTVDGVATEAPETKAPFASRWNPAGTAAGSHQVQAEAQVGTDRLVVLRRAARVGAPHFGVGLRQTNFNQARTLIEAVVTPPGTEPYPPVQLQIDGKTVATLASGTGSTSLGCTGCVYQFLIDNTEIGYGAHSLRLIAAPGTTNQSEHVASVFVNRAPALTMEKPFGGQVVSGDLVVKGRFVDDGSNALAVFRIGSKELQRSAGGDFEFTAKLDGIAAGRQILTIVVTDALGAQSTQTIEFVVQEAAAAKLEPVTWLDGSGDLLDVEGTTSVVSMAGQVRRIKADGTQALAPTFATYDGNGVWQASAGYAVASTRLTAQGEKRIYAWTADGTRSDLSQLSGYLPLAPYPEIPVASGDPAMSGSWVAWQRSLTVKPGDSNPLLIRNLANGEQQVVPLPAGIDSIQFLAGHNGSGLTLRAGSPLLVFSARTVATGVHRVYGYDGNTKVTTSAADFAQSQPLGALIDGERIAWTGAPNPPNTGTELWVKAWGSAAGPTLISSNASEPRLKDGLLAWNERAASGTTVFAADATGKVTSLAVDQQARLQDVAAGAVAYSTGDGKLYLWTAAGGSRLILSGGLRYAMLTKGWLYLVVADGKSLYRVAW